MQYGEDRLADGKKNVTSDKHDLLYSRARCVLNQRHIKRPWFNLNPFLERTDETIDLKNYLPEESKYIQRLESLVLCENYRSDYPTDTRELEIGGFFEYLYSGAWREGNSVRILEGQLLDLLLHTLNKLHTRGDVVCHTTYAFARNRRPRTGCYKLADKETFGYFDETLLLEFTYFGRLSKEEPNTVTSHPLAYLRADDHDRRVIVESPPPVLMPLTSYQLDSLPESPQSRRRSRAASISIDSAQIRSRLLKPPTETQLECTAAMPGTQGKRRHSLMKSLNAIRAVQALQKVDGRRSSLPPTAQHLQIFKTIPEKRKDSLLESRKSERKRSNGVLGTGLFGGNKARKFNTFDIDSLTEDDDNESPEEEEQNSADVQHLGEELYLADADKYDKTKNLETTAKKLHRLQSELHVRREQVKRRKEENAVRYKQNPPGLPPLPPLDLETALNKFHYTLGMPDKLPTFEEFIKLLNQEEQSDPRFKNMSRKKTKRVAQRYNQEHPSSRYNMSNVSMARSKYNADSSYLRMHTPGRKASNSSRKNSFVDVGQDGCRLPVLREKSNRKLDKNSRRTSMASITRDRWQYADDVLGVTDSEPCKEHWLKQTGPKGKEGTDKLDKYRRHHTPSQQFKRRTSMSVTPVKTPDILVVSPSGKSECVYHGSKATVNVQSPMFPKISVCNVNERESPDVETEESESESESEPEDTSSFDSSKLNTKYSIERLRKKRRTEKKNKKPVFYDVLKKYYRMQAALKLFRKGSAGTEERAAKLRSRRLGLAHFLKGNQVLESESVVGSLKKFRFQETKERKKINLNKLSMANFSSPDIERFENQLEAALDHFVVRREIVVSGINSRCAMSVTFNRQSAFRLKQT